MSSYFLTRQAHCDLEAAEDFLLPRNAEAAHRFLIRAVETFELLAKRPELGRRRSDIRVGLRSYSWGSYVAYYRIAKGEVHILRVLHGARDAAAILTMIEELGEG